MALKIIKYYIVLLVIFFSWANFASASVTISQVNLDPTEERFIKLYNNSDSSQDITGWSIKRKSSSGLEYSLVASSRLENKVITPKGYFVLTNESTYTGTLSPDATWAKSNTFAEGNTIILYNQNDEAVDSFIVSKAVGNTVQNTDEENNTEETATTTSSSTSLKTTENEILKISTKIISPKTITVGIPFSFSSQTTTNTGKTYAVGRFVWNLGDGKVFESSKADPFDYMYEYPGEYSVNLSYFSSNFSKVADATDKISVKVVPANIYISSVGDGIDPFIELENKSNYEVVLSDWIVKAGVKFFTLPEGTIILPNKKIKLSPKITRFTGNDIKSVAIINPTKNVVATYPAEVKYVTPKNTSTYATVQKSVSAVNKNPQNSPEVINLNDLGADAEGSGVSIPNSTYAWIGLLVIIGLGVASFWLIKRRDNVADYIEKEIRAEDMTIVE